MTTPFQNAMLGSPKRIGLLLGAGASRPLGLPLMKDFVGPEYRTKLGNTDQEILFDIAMNWAFAQGPTALDFELLYTAVETLAQLQVEDTGAIAFVPHVNGRGMLYKGDPNVVPSPDWVRRSAGDVRERLKSLVHDRVGTVDPSASVHLFAPLFAELIQFSNGVPVLQCFTTNYDRSIEAIWEADLQRKISGSPSLNRGFRQLSPHRQLELDLTSYSSNGGPDAQATINLYKLHGGLNWIRDGARILESPTNEYLRRNAVIYPLRKHSFDSPFKDLIGLFASVLAQLDLLVVIGNSLRDSHIREALATAMKARSAFKVVILDPSAHSLKESFGDDYDESLFPGAATFGESAAITELKDRLYEAATYGVL